MTLIEIIADLIEDHQDGSGMPQVETVLVPEQCMEVFFEGRYYHITVEELEDD